MVISTFGTTKVDKAHRPYPETIKRWLNEARALDQHDIVEGYLERHGLSKLPTPEYVSADMCWVYRPIESDGGVSGYRRIVHRGLPDSLIKAIEKDFLLAPPAMGFETPESPSSGPLDGAVQAGTDETKAAEAKIPCDRTWGNGKPCTREFATAGRLRRHIREKHSEEEK